MNKGKSQQDKSQKKVGPASSLTTYSGLSGFRQNSSCLRGKRIHKHLYVFAWLFITLLGIFLFADAAAGRTLFRKQAKISLGNEIFCRDFPAELEGRKLGLVINQTSFLPDGDFLAGRLIEGGKTIAAIFTPEHGLAGVIESGKDVKDSKWNDIPVISLYGKQKKPTPLQTRDLDAFVYDIQDVGARFYTYVATLKGILEAAADAGIPVYVLDRPNPAGGEIVEGPVLDPQYDSLIAPLPIPTRYGLTVGELAQMMKGSGCAPRSVDLHIVKMEGWRREMTWDETGIAWIPSSPNIPTSQTAHIYPGTGLFSALNINEGRGTRSPFMVFGAPWLDAAAIVKNLTANYAFPVELEATSYTPVSMLAKASTPLYQDKLCRGVRIKIINERDLPSLRFALAVMKSLKERHTADLIIDRKYLAQMFGTDALYLFLTGKKDWATFLSEIEHDEKLFLERRHGYLLY